MENTNTVCCTLRKGSQIIAIIQIVGGILVGIYNVAGITETWDDCKVWEKLQNGHNTDFTSTTCYWILGDHVIGIFTLVVDISNGCLLVYSIRAKLIKGLTIWIVIESILVLFESGVGIGITIGIKLVSPSYRISRMYLTYVLRNSIFQILFIWVIYIYKQVLTPVVHRVDSCDL